MFFPIINNDREKFFLNENIAVDRGLINERLHSFNWQRKVSCEIARKFLPFVSTLTEEPQKYVFDVDIENPGIRQVVLLAHKAIAFVNSGSFVEYRTESKIAIIEVRIANTFSKNFERELAAIIGHELSHVGSIANKYESGVKNFNLPEQYEKIIQVMRETQKFAPNTIEHKIYEYCYAMYCTSSIEIDAFISQTELELRKLSEKDTLTIEEVKKYLPLTTSCQAFSLAKEVARGILSKTKYEKEWFIGKLQEHGINVENIDSQMKHLIYRADYALEKCAANAMLTVEGKSDEQ